MTAALHQTPVELSDLEIARRVSAGDLAAFEILMRRCNQIMFRAARAILGNDADAEEAVQEAYLLAFRAIGAFRGSAKLSTWLVRIAANQALARRRKDQRRAVVVPIRGGLDEQGIEAGVTTREADGPAERAGRAEIRRLLEARIDALPEEFRAVFVLRALEELSVEETAAALGIAAATVRSRFFRARSRLREALSQEVDLALDDAFAFAGARCDRMVQTVLRWLRTRGPDVS
ncbi:MAG: RNA polymerase sigma factor [Betaproteobacteria bacterium]|nr:MAG: RNA polymerase sigma factor [Betaproteobacteria bacterium]